MQILFQFINVQEILYALRLNPEKQVNLVNQIYNPSIPQTFNIRLMYMDGIVKVYSGDQQMLTDNFNFTSIFGSEALYVGFTGFFRGSRKELC